MYRIKLLEEISGTGDIYDGDTLLFSGVRYQIAVYQKMLDGTIPSLKDITARISADQSVIWQLMNRKATLRLEDGRRMDFFIADGSGNIANANGQGLYEV